MKTNFTPGPWEVSRDAAPDYAPQFTVYSELDSGRVATAFRSENNARLIAAAPELYAALRMICDAGIPLADEIESAMLAALAKVND